ncbi:MAG: hypothetical protein IJ593_12640 [Lachnospiraceae bacterium]|nr:hypothetical protein [Lachnospiraceae bacterium]MBR1455470.1 hypothetical protein [Lachnospiraceae bacterium]
MKHFKLLIMSMCFMLCLTNKNYTYYFYDNNQDWTGTYHEYPKYTEVITAVEVYAADGFPRQSKTPHTLQDLEAKAGFQGSSGECVVSFSIPGARYVSNSNMKGAIPQGGSALFWVKWKTPDEATTVTVNVTCSSGATIVCSGGQSASITCKIYDMRDYLEEPPDTNFNDEDEGYSSGAPLDRLDDNNYRKWKTYAYYWCPDWHYVCTRSGSDATGYPEDYGDDPHGKDDVTCMMHECPEDAENHVCPTGDCTLQRQDWGEGVWIEFETGCLLELVSQKLQAASNTPFVEGTSRDFTYYYPDATAAFQEMIAELGSDFRIEEYAEWLKAHRNTFVTSTPQQVRSGYGLLYPCNFATSWEIVTVPADFESLISSQPPDNTVSVSTYNTNWYNQNKYNSPYCDYNYTYPQGLIFYYPEFGYDDYADIWSWEDWIDNNADPTSSAYGSDKSHVSQNFNPKNYYSHFGTITNQERVHYIPIYWPDGDYEVLCECTQAYCPGGHLFISVSDKVEITGSLWDDLHIRQTNKIK